MALRKKVIQEANNNLTILVLLVLVGFVAFGVGLVRAQSGRSDRNDDKNEKNGSNYDVAQATNYVKTESSSYEDMPGMEVSFQNSKNKPAVMLFSTSSLPISEEHETDECGYNIRLVVDGKVQSNEIPIDHRTPSSESFQFVTETLTSGKHTAKIQWRFVTNNYELGCSQSRSMVVMHE